MTGLIYAGMGLVALWLQVTLAPLISVFGIKPSLMLITVLVLTLRWMDPAVFVFAALLGMGQDVFSHGVLGVYALSFFLVSFAARYAGAAIYDQTVLHLPLLVGGLSILEGVVSLLLLGMTEDGVAWLPLFFSKTLPAALYNAALAPLWLLVLPRLERVRHARSQ